MKTLCWNARGLGNPRALRALRHLVESNKPQLIFLMETKCDVRKCEQIKRELNFDCGLFVPCKGRNGGLLLCWKEDSDVRILSYSEGHIDAIIKKTHGFWRFSGFYGNPETEKRKFSWSLMEKLSETGDDPWIIGGDFNEIVSDEEKKGGAKRNPNQMNLFRETINRCNLIDGGYNGSKFTWRRGKNKRTQICERLDKFLINNSMAMSTNRFKVTHLSFLSSDHRPIVASWDFLDEP